MFHCNRYRFAADDYTTPLKSDRPGDHSVRINFPRRGSVTSCRERNRAPRPAMPRFAVAAFRLARVLTEPPSAFWVSAETLLHGPIIERDVYPPLPELCNLILLWMWGECRLRLSSKRIDANRAAVPSRKVDKSPTKQPRDCLRERKPGPCRYETTSHSRRSPKLRRVSPCG